MAKRFKIRLPEKTPVPDELFEFVRRSMKGKFDDEDVLRICVVLTELVKQPSLKGDKFLDDIVKLIQSQYN